MQECNGCRKQARPEIRLVPDSATNFDSFETKAPTATISWIGNAVDKVVLLRDTQTEITSSLPAFCCVAVR